MGLLSKHSDAIIHLAACILLSSFIVNNETVKGIGFVCAALLAVPSAIAVICDLIKKRKSFLFFESRRYWSGLIIIAAALLYNAGYVIALALLILGVFDFLLAVFSKEI